MDSWRIAFCYSCCRNEYTFCTIIDLPQARITEDLYKGILRPKASDRELIWLGRVMVLAVAGLAIYIAQDPNSQVFGLVKDAWAGFGSAFGPIVLLSLFGNG